MVQEVDLQETDTRKRIINASTHLFGLKGYHGTSTREIAKMASVNISSLNYHFKSKQNLLQEVFASVVTEFKEKITDITTQNVTSASDYALRVYETLTEDESKCLNQFKLFLDAQSMPYDLDPYPLGYEQFAIFLDKELNPLVPLEEKLWANNIVFSYLIQTAVMSATNVGKKYMEVHFKQKDTVNIFIKQLIETIIRDLNLRYH